MAKPPVVAAPVHRGSRTVRVAVIDGIPLTSGLSWPSSGGELSECAGSEQAGRTVVVDRPSVWPYMAFEGEEQGTGSEGEAARPAGGDQEDADPPVVRESVELAGYLWPTPGEGATLAARATATVYVGLFR